MRKMITLILMILVSLSIVSCNSFEPKEKHGVDALFDEPLGFYTKDASIIKVNDSKKYVYYTTNEEEFVQKDVIAFRELNLVENEWIATEKQVILRPGNTWDSQRVSNPDVVKGLFNYGGQTYEYIMAYQGNSILAEKQFQIGLAVSNNPEGPWVKVGVKPFVEFDASIYGSTFGAGQPSLVSYNEEGQVRLFYTFADEFLTSTRLMELDLSDLSNPIGTKSYLTVSVNGMTDKDLGNIAMLNNADFTIDETGQLYVIRDRHPYSGFQPLTSESLQLSYADINILYYIGNQSIFWNNLIKNFNDSYTAKGDLLGYSRIFSGSYITDEYGRISSDNIEISYTSQTEMSSEEDVEYIYSAQIHTYEVE